MAKKGVVPKGLKRKGKRTHVVKSSTQKISININSHNKRVGRRSSAGTPSSSSGVSFIPVPQPFPVYNTVVEPAPSISRIQKVHEGSEVVNLNQVGTHETVAPPRDERMSRTKGKFGFEGAEIHAEDVIRTPIQSRPNQALPLSRADRLEAEKEELRAEILRLGGRVTVADNTKTKLKKLLNNVKKKLPG